MLHIYLAIYIYAMLTGIFVDPNAIGWFFTVCNNLKANNLKLVRPPYTFDTKGVSHNANEEV